MTGSKKDISSVQRTEIFMTLLAAAFLTSMSTTVTGNMIPNFIAFFGVSSNLAQWLTSGAALVSGITMPMTSFMIKRIPNKAYFLSAMTFFTAGSLAAFLSVNFSMLLISRLLQAIGCGMLLPFIQVILLKLYPKEKHGTIMGAYSMASMVSAVVGPTYTGFVLDSFGWKGVFVSLFIAGILIVICGIIFIKNITDKETANLNILDAVLSSAGFAAFLIGVSNTGSGLFAFKSGGCILAGLVLLITFTMLQLKAENPMLNLRLFSNRPFRVASFLNLCMYLITMGNAMILPIFTKSIRGFSDTAYGLATIAGSVLSVFAALSAGRLYDKTGIKPMFMSGAGLFAVFSIMGFFLSQNTPILYIAVIFAVQSVALSVLNSPATALALSGLEGQERIDGSAIYNTLRQISSSLGSMLSVLIYTLIGSSITAVHGVYGYYGLITAAIAAAIISYLKKEKPSDNAGK